MAKQQFPQAGDGIVMNSDGRRGVVRRRITRGIHAVNDGDPTTHPDDLISVEADFRKHGRVISREVLAGTFQQETFAQHLTRPSGFGKMKWPVFAFVQAVFIGAVINDPASWWMVGIAFVVVNGALTLGAYFNYVRRWV